MNSHASRAAAATASELSPEAQRELLRLARHTIELEARGEAAAAPPCEVLPAELQPPRATFVTLHKQSQLRGCCGSLEAFEPLAWNVVRSSRAAAFSDRRFSPVTADEVSELDIHISILSPSEPLDCLTEADLVSQLRPGVDGLILIEADLKRQAVFLPAVWEQISSQRQFVQRLKHKAGLPMDYWSPWMQARRFAVQSIPATDPPT
jgi:AmmeMemoRadiSam system protein A